MLTTELLISRFNGETLVPKQLELKNYYLDLSGAAIDCFRSAIGATQGQLDAMLAELEGDRPDFRVLRGFAHLLKSDSFSKIEIVSPLPPSDLRQRVYGLAAGSVPSVANTKATIQKIAAQLSTELDREVIGNTISGSLYADLPDNRILTSFDPPTPEALIHRYNVSQVQGIFYRAVEIEIDAYRNDPGEYKILFRYLKLFQLMSYIEGDADTGFTIRVDGPASLFNSSTRYGLAIAKLIPAILHVTKWQLRAKLQVRDRFDNSSKIGSYLLNSDCGLVTHYPAGKTYDSMLEQSFVERWQKLKTPWRLEREVDLIPIPGSVMIPDFRLVHPDGRTYLLEIVGYWRKEYLQKKFARVRKANLDFLILAISERLNLEKAGLNVEDLPCKVIWFKDKLQPKSVLEIIETK
jgi:uncharacterized protein